MAYLKPTIPIQNTNNDYIYPQTTADQVIDGTERLNKTINDYVTNSILNNYVTQTDQNNMFFRGLNPIASTADDTVANWKALGTGIWFFNRTGRLNNQPNQYGFLINLVNTVALNDIIQIWLTQPQGYTPVYVRGGNNTGWNTVATDSGTWYPMYKGQLVSTLPASPLANVLYFVTT